MHDLFRFFLKLAGFMSEFCVEKNTSFLSDPFSFALTDLVALQPFGRHRDAHFAACALLLSSFSSDPLLPSLAALSSPL